MLIQTLFAKLGIATGQSLPEVCRARLPRRFVVGLWLPEGHPERSAQPGVGSAARQAAAPIASTLARYFSEIALVVTSITMIMDNRRYWYFGVLAVVGIVAAGSGFLVH